MAVANPILANLAARQPKIGVPFLEAFRVQHGPPGLLGRFFLSADARMNDRKIRLQFISFEELLELSERNADNWGSPNPMFNPHLVDIPPGSMCLAGFDDKGVIKVCASAKPFDATRIPFGTLVNTGAFLALKPEFAADSYVTTMPASEASDLRGVLGYCGAVWVHPDRRGDRLASIITHLTNACVLTLWNPTYLLGSVEQTKFGTPLQQRYGFPHLSVSIKITKASKPVTELALLWMTADDAYTGLGRYLEVIWPEIDAAVAARNRQQSA